MRRHRLMQGQRVEVVLAILPALLALTGCGGRDSGNVVASGVLGDPTTFQEMKLATVGGYGPASSPGAACDLEGPQTTTVSAAPPRLSWDYCRTANGSSTPEKQAGSRDITAAELASVEDALQHVTVSERKNCGADASVMTLDIKSTAGVALYADDFYSGCPWDVHVGRTFVTGIGNLDSALQPLGSE